MANNKKKKKKEKNLGILIQIARGLKLISTNGFVHLDIKLENILFKKKKRMHINMIL